MNYPLITRLVYEASLITFWQWSIVILMLLISAEVWFMLRLDRRREEQKRRGIVARQVDEILSHYAQGPAVGTWAPEAKHPLDSRPYPRKPKRTKKARKQ